MIGPIANLDANVLRDLLLYYLPAMALGMLLGIGAGWGLAQAFGRNLKVIDDTHSWLRNFPITPLLAFGAVVLPFLDLPLVPAGILLAVVAAPTAFVLAIRYYNVQNENSAQAKLDRQAVLRSGWQDTNLVGLAFLLSSFVYTALVPEARDSVSGLLSNLTPGLIFGGIGGGVLGLALASARNRLAGYLEQRRHRGEYSLAVDGILDSFHGGIESLLTQFHGTSLAMVLAIAAAALPYTTASHTLVLPLMIATPLASAVLAARMVKNPAPNEPGIWHHLRKGMANVAQICVGYLVGAAMLAPLDLVHAWILDQPDQVNDALLTHLDLTFVGLAYSLFLGLLGGIVSSRVEVLRTILINLGNIGRTIPSLAVLALALPLVGIGRTPSLVALVFIGTLPILVNTSVGIIGVSHDVKEAARGMGMNDLQVLVRVEIPVAMPVIMAGVRTSAVLVVASATLAGFIGGGGLGALIIRGDGSGRDDILFTGAILATILSIFLEYFFGWLETLLTPRGLRET